MYAIRSYYGAEIQKELPAGAIEIAKVDADVVADLVKLIKEVEADIVINVALPYQDLTIMDACVKTKVHYLDTANYEHPDLAKFEYKEQWARDKAFKDAGIMGLLGSGFDPGATNVFCAYAQKHYFDEIHTRITSYNVCYTKLLRSTKIFPFQRVWIHEYG